MDQSTYKYFLSVLITLEVSLFESVVFMWDGRLCQVKKQKKEKHFMYWWKYKPEKTEVSVE